MQYKILHDHGLPLCFIGDTHNNDTLFNYFKDIRPCEKILIEEIKKKDKNWFAARQFMSCGTGQAFKKQIVDSLEEFNLNWFSAISANTHLGHDVKIGHNTFINNFNVIYDETIIGNHCVITAFVCISHSVSMEDFCHISPYSYLCFTKLGKGVYIGTRSTFRGNEQNILNITDWCNFMLDSVVTGNVTEAGTYYGKRKYSSETSLTLSI
jgi:NDP-sugar pyrophosphorylase family protein